MPAAWRASLPAAESSLAALRTATPSAASGGGAVQARGPRAAAALGGRARGQSQRGCRPDSQNPRGELDDRFAAFFVVVFTLSWALMPHPRAWQPFILVASYVFYGWVDWRWVLILIGSSVVNTFAAQVIARSPSQTTRKRALAAAVVFDLGLLCVFKYLGFFVSELDSALDEVGLGSPLPLVQIVLPIGISFFTFQAISYVVDVYRGETRAASLVEVAILQAFFLTSWPDRSCERTSTPAAAHAARPARGAGGAGIVPDRRRAGQEDGDR